jgi:hypothetical protein
VAWSWKTLTQSVTDLAARLDALKIFWVADELQHWVVESLRCWNAAAQFSRDRCILSTTASQTFYDLTSTTDCGSGATNPPALLGYTLTDRDLINQLEYNLLESHTVNWPAGWAGTEQFTLDDLASALQRRRDQFLLETGLVLSRSTVVPVSDRVALSDQIIDIRRAAWRDATTGTYKTLWKADEWEANSLSHNWENTAATPKAYSTILTPHVSLQLIPPPAPVGSLELITVNAGAAFNPTVSATLLGIPDDFAWVVRFGALADLLGKDGQASDPLRSKYCEQRWEEGLKLAGLSATVQLAQINGRNVFPNSLHDLDSLRANWQNQLATPLTPPTSLAVAGRNLIAVTPTPDATPSSVTLEVLRNMPVPTAGSDFLQIGREQYEAILMYATHLAAFKMQGSEFLATLPGLDNMYRLATQNNPRLLAAAKYFKALQSGSKTEGIQRPRREEEAA